MTMSDLSNLPSEVIQLCDAYYVMVDQLYWYLKHTQDMPNTIEDEIMRQVAKLNKKISNLQLYINAILAGEDLESIEFESDIPPAEQHSAFFESEGELLEKDEAEDFIQPEIYPDEDEEEGESAQEE